MYKHLCTFIKNTRVGHSNKKLKKLKFWLIFYSGLKFPQISSRNFHVFYINSFLMWSLLTFQVFIALGILLCYIMGRSLEWNWLALAACLFLFPFVFGLYFIPESPPWLIYNDEEDLAYKSMLMIRQVSYSIISQEGFILYHILNKICSRFSYCRVSVVELTIRWLCSSVIVQNIKIFSSLVI